MNLKCLLILTFWRKCSNHFTDLMEQNPAFNRIQDGGDGCKSNIVTGEKQTESIPRAYGPPIDQHISAHLIFRVTEESPRIHILPLIYMKNGENEKERSNESNFRLIMKPRASHPIPLYCAGQSRVSGSLLAAQDLTSPLEVFYRLSNCIFFFFKNQAFYYDGIFGDSPGRRNIFTDRDQSSPSKPRNM